MITKNNKVITFTSIIAAVLVMGGAILSASNIKLNVNNLIRGRATEAINGSISFSRSTGTHVVRSNDYYYTSGKTTTGNTLYLRNHSGTTLGNNYVAVMENGGEITFTETNVGTNPTHYQFQKITSIYARSTSFNSRLLEIRTSSDGVNYSSSYQDFYVTSSGSTFSFDSSGAKYVKITYSSNLTVFLEELVLSYSCTPGGESEKELLSIDVKTEPSSTSYTEGDYFNPTGLVITATYNDSSTEDVPYSGNEDKFSFSPSLSTTLTTSDTSVTVTFGGKSCSQSISVEQGGGEVSSLSGLYSFTNATQYSTTTVIMDFNNNYYYKDGAIGNKLYFTYEIDGSTITFTLEASRGGSSSCDYGMFATNYRLFGSTNANGTTKSGSLSNSNQTITVVINNYSRDFTKQ